MQGMVERKSLALVGMFGARYRHLRLGRKWGIGGRRVFGVDPDAAVADLHVSCRMHRDHIQGKG